MSVSVYVGAPLTMFREAREVQQILREQGFTITHDWTAELEAGIPEKIGDAEAAIIAQQCIAGVAKAKFSIFILHPLVETKGAWVELGAALNANQHCIVLVPPKLKGGVAIDSYMTEILFSSWFNRAVFIRHPQCHIVDSHTTLQEKLNEIAAHFRCEKRGKKR